MSACENSSVPFLNLDVPSILLKRPLTKCRSGLGSCGFCYRFILKHRSNLLTNRGLGEMTTDYYQAERGRKIFGTSLLFFSQGLYWFGVDLPGGIFTLRPL